MSGFAHDVAGGSGDLVIDSLQSPNFVHGISGWSINKDGSAEFHDVIIPNAGTVVIFAPTAPSSPNDGDVWYNTADGLAASVRNGTEWVPYQIGPAAISNLSSSLVGQPGAVLNPNPYFTGGDGSGWAGYLGTFDVVDGASIGGPAAFVGEYAGPAGGVAYEGGGSFSVLPGTPVLVSAVVSSSVAGVAIGLNADGAVMQTVTVTPGNWTAIQAVINVPDGANTAWVQIGPAAEDGTVDFWGLSAQPQVPGTLIQAESITADQIAAESITADRIVVGIVLAGAVDGTTITGAVFEGTNFIENQDGLFFYDGTPAAGNLIASIAPASGSDSFGNGYVAGIAAYNGGLTVQLSDGTLQLYPFTGTPHTSGQVFAGSTGHLTFNSPTETSTDSESQMVLASKAAIGSGVPSGSQQIIDAIDGNAYNTQISTQALTSDTGTLTGLTTVFSQAVGPRTYRIHGQLFISATSGAEFTSQVTLPAGAGGKYSAVICRSTTFNGQVTGPPNTSNGIAVSLATATYAVTIDGVLTVTASGTLHFQVGSLTGTGLVVEAASSIDIIPV